MENDKKLDVEELERFLIRKKEVDEALWKRISNESKGTNRDKITAGILVLQNYGVVPPEADTLLKALVERTQPEDVRKAIASELVESKANIPLRL